MVSRGSWARMVVDFCLASGSDGRPLRVKRELSVVDSGKLGRAIKEKGNLGTRIFCSVQTWNSFGHRSNNGIPGKIVTEVAECKVPSDTEIR